MSLPSQQKVPEARLRMKITGAVQGVGFRPFVYRLATEIGLAGWVVNNGSGVEIEAQGPGSALVDFARRVTESPPPNAQIHRAIKTWLEPGEQRRGVFEIHESRGGERLTASVLPDLVMCPNCLADITEEGNRRYHYPFTNCTDCGPRLSIIRGLPYDRARTTMEGFSQCPECREEYSSPLSRRFHAQPNACPACGPHLGWWTGGGEPLMGLGTVGDASRMEDDAVLDEAAATILAGGIVGVKGLGGFHLMVHAFDDVAVGKLRRRKGRVSKPLAVMVRTVDEATRLAHVDSEAASLLASPAAPIVLLPVRAGSPLASSIAPDNPRVGIMLAYTPLHWLLLERVSGPVVATSGNRSDEPICIENKEAVARLGPIVDGFVMHDRPIQRPVDDSVVQVVSGTPRFIRRSRGYAPLPLNLAGFDDVPDLLATGGHMKNTVAVSRAGRVYLSQHLGDLDGHLAQQNFQRTLRDYQRLYRIVPAAVAHDQHPGYASTQWVDHGDDAPTPHVRRIPVQHHHAHLASVLAEAGVQHNAEPALGVIWDGTGFGSDGTIWGGEFLVGGLAYSERVAHLRTFPLPGGEAAVREPRRSAAGVLHESGMLKDPGVDSALGAFDRDDLEILIRATERGLNAPRTSSAGRLFDAMASLLGLRQLSHFEGQAAMALEAAVDPEESGKYLMHYEYAPGRAARWDWGPMVEAVIADRTLGVPVGVIAARIHNGFVDCMVRTAEMIGLETVVLSGGCFHNAVLLERATERLEAQGHRVLTNRYVSPGDGGIALGQIAAAAARLAPGLVQPGRTIFDGSDGSCA